VLAGNRDEFHARPTQKAGWWPDKPEVVGGRDLQAGGTWLALHRSGRFATVTNYRDAEPVSAKFRSRGHLVTDFLKSEMSPLEYLGTVDRDRYAGFNLIVGDSADVAYLSNRGADARVLPAGIYGLSNALLDGAWNKVERSKRGLRDLLDRDAINETTLLRLLNDRTLAPTEEVDSSSLGFDLAHAITAPFIVTPSYGTRCSTVVIADTSGAWRLTERRFDAAGSSTGESRFDFSSRASLS
jgi:uncharacterized protein with NRDE domain